MKGEIAYMLHAITTFNDQKDLTEDREFKLLISRLSRLKIKHKDRKPVENIIFPIVDRMEQQLISLWERETKDLIKPYIETNPDFYQTVRHLTALLYTTTDIGTPTASTPRQKQFNRGRTPPPRILHRKHKNDRRNNTLP